MGEIWRPRENPGEVKKRRYKRDVNLYQVGEANLVFFSCFLCLMNKTRKPCMCSVEEVHFLYTIIAAMESVDVLSF